MIRTTGCHAGHPFPLKLDSLKKVRVKHSTGGIEATMLDLPPEGAVTVCELNCNLGKQGRQKSNGYAGHFSCARPEILTAGSYSARWSQLRHCFPGKSSSLRCSKLPKKQSIGCKEALCTPPHRSAGPVLPRHQARPEPAGRAAHLRRPSVHARRGW